jgi:hypothetical protein
MVANALEGGEPGDGDGSRVLEGQVRRLGRELVGSGPGVHGERGIADAARGVARLEAGHARTDCLDGSGEAPATVAVLRPAEAEIPPGEWDRQAGQ